MTITSGGGPSATVVDILNASWDLGNSIKAEHSSTVADLTAVSGLLDPTTAPTVSSGTVASPVITEPLVTLPTDADTTTILNTFDSKYAQLVQLLSGEFDTFRRRFFPDESEAYTAAECYLLNSITNPDAGIPPAVAEQLLAQGRDKIVADANRASADALKTFANLRFPRPSGAAAAAVLEIQQKAQDGIAETARKITELAIENLRFAVTTAISNRQAALGACIEYVKAIASGPDIASRVIGVGYDAQSKLINAVSTYYNARTAAKEVVAKVAQFNVSSTLDADSKNQASKLKVLEERVQTVVSEAQQLGTMAASLFNNLHAQASINASASNAVSYNYSNDTVSAPPSVTSVGG